MVSSLLSCWTVRVRLASRPGLLLLLGEGNDDEEEDGDADINLLTPTISGQNKEEKGFDPAGAAADSMDLQAVGLLPPRRGATKINLQKITCRNRHAQRYLQPTHDRHKEGCNPTKNAKGFDPAAATKMGFIPAAAETGLDPVAADEGLDPSDANTGLVPAIKHLGLAPVNEQGLVPIEEKLGLCPAPANEDDLLLLQTGISDLDTDDEHAVADPDDEHAADAEFAKEAESEYDDVAADEAASAASADFDDDEFDDKDVESAIADEDRADSAADEDACAHAVDGGDVTAPDEGAHSDLLLMTEDSAEDAAIEFSPDEEDAASAAAGALSFPPTVYTVSDDAESADEGLDPQPVKIGQIPVENQGFHAADNEALQPQIALQGEFFPFSIAESCLHAGEIWKLSFLKRLRVAIQKLAYDTLAYADVIITHAMPRIDSKVKKKKTSLLLCVTINMPFHPGERKMPHAATAGQPKEPVYLFSPLRGSKSEVKDREKKLHVFVEMNPYAARLKMKTKLFMLLFIQAILDPG